MPRPYQSTNVRYVVVEGEVYYWLDKQLTNKCMERNICKFIIEKSDKSDRLSCGIFQFNPDQSDASGNCLAGNNPDQQIRCDCFVFVNETVRKKLRDEFLSSFSEG